MCMFVFIDTDSWDLIVHDSTSDLVCVKKELRESLLKKESAIKNCHKYFYKKIHFSFQVYKKDRSQLRSSTLYGFRSQQDKKNFRSATLVLLY